MERALSYTRGRIIEMTFARVTLYIRGVPEGPRIPRRTIPVKDADTYTERNVWIYEWVFVHRDGASFIRGRFVIDGSVARTLLSVISARQRYFHRDIRTFAFRGRPVEKMCKSVEAASRSRRFYRGSFSFVWVSLRKILFNTSALNFAFVARLPISWIMNDDEDRD